MKKTVNPNGSVEWYDEETQITARVTPSGKVYYSGGRDGELERLVQDMETMARRVEPEKNYERYTRERDNGIIASIRRALGL